MIERIKLIERIYRSTCVLAGMVLSLGSVFYFAMVRSLSNVHYEPYSVIGMYLSGIIACVLWILYNRMEVE